jgi:hypothetical protein
MNCARCGNALHRIPMFDLPRKVREFSCMCCGERFWTTQGEATVLADVERPGSKSESPELAVHPTIGEFSPITHRN